MQDCSQCTFEIPYTDSAPIKIDIVLSSRRFIRGMYDALNTYLPSHSLHNYIISVILYSGYES